MRVTERIEGCYEAQEVPFGRVYVWRPGRVVIECDCGESLVFTGPATICECGADPTSTLRETPAAEQSRDEDLYPWRYLGDYIEAGYIAGRVFDAFD